MPSLHRTLLLLLALIPSTKIPGLRGQDEVPSPHPNFVFFRYASLTSLSLYGGYGQGRWLGFFGMIQNPRTSYREIAGGAGATLALTPRVGGLLALAGADASDAWYGQLYLQVNVRLSPIASYLSVAYYEPLESGGARQLKLNPVLLMVRASRRVELGGAYLFLGSSRSDDIHQLGPALQIGVPHGRTLLELLKRLSDSRFDFRVTFQAYL